MSPAFPGFASNRKSFAIFTRCAVLLLANLLAIPGSAQTKLPPNVPSADFFVAPDGKDSWSGTLSSPNSQKTDGPFASIARAQIAVRNLIQHHPNRTIVVMIRQGVYYLPLSPTNPGTLNFTTADSGTSQMPVVWENYPNEVPIVSAGEAITKGTEQINRDGFRLTWTNTSGNLWQVQLPANTQPFEHLFYKKNGRGRRLRSRLQSGSGVGYYVNNGACYATVTGQTVALANCNLGTFLRVAAEVPPGNTGCPSVKSGTQSNG